MKGDGNSGIETKDKGVKTNNQELLAYIVPNYTNRGFELTFYQLLSDNKIAVVSEIVMETVDSPAHASIFIGDITAHSLMDQLWSAGIRPADHRDISEIIKAKDSHINDLRLVLNAYLKKAEEK